MTHFNQNVKVDKVVNSSFTLSPDSRVVSIIFDDLSARLENQELSAVKSISIGVEFDDFIPLILKIDIRGFVEVQKENKVFGLAKIGDITVPLTLPALSGEFSEEIQVNVSAKFQILSLIMIVEKTDNQEKREGMVGIDSVDMQICDPETKVNMPIFEIYQNHPEEFRWRLKAPNGEILGNSGEGYAQESDCRERIQLLKKYCWISEVTSVNQ